MADEKTFKTKFLIGAQWTGQKGVQQAQRAMGGLGKAAQTANVRMRGMTASVFKGVTAQRVLEGTARKVVQVLEMSIAAATEAQEAHDELGLSIERMSKRYRNTMGKSVSETSKIVEESTQALIKASEEMERSGHDAETLQKGWAKLAATGALDPRQILQQRQAFSDVLSYIDGANATAEESVQLGEQWADAILRGNIALLKQMDLTDGEIQLLKNVNAMVKKGTITGEEGIKRRQDLVLKFAKKFEGETKRVFEKPSGKIAQMYTQIGNVLETLGEPFVKRAPEMAASFTKVAEAAGPLATIMADMTDEGLKRVSTKLEDMAQPDSVERIKSVWWYMKEIQGYWDKINEIKWSPFIALWNAVHGGEPAKLPQLPGAPSQEPIPGGPGTGGKAAERAAEGRKRLEAEAKARAEAEKATGAGWGTPSEPKILKDFKIGEETAAAAWQPVATEAASKAAASAVAQAGDPAHVKRVLAEAENRRIPASIRNRNPGAQYPDPGGSAERFGTIGTQTLHTPQGRTHYIAQFPTAMHGAASNFWLLAHKKKNPYVGMSIRNAMLQWSGGYRDVPGPAGKYDPDTKITPEMVNDPKFAIPFMQAIASGEAPGGEKALTQAQWEEAYRWYQAGKPGGGGGAAPVAAAPAAPAPTETIRRAAPATPNLKDILNDMNIKRRTGFPSSTNVSMNPTINVNGVAPGRESLMAKKTMLALRDPLNEGLKQLREMRAEDRRTNFA